MWDVTFINTQTGLPKTIYGVISIVAEMGDKTEQFSPLTLVHKKQDYADIRLRSSLSTKIHFH